MPTPARPAAAVRKHPTWAFSGPGKPGAPGRRYRLPRESHGEQRARKNPGSLPGSGPVWNLLRCSCLLAFVGVVAGSRPHLQPLISRCAGFYPDRAEPAGGLGSRRLVSNRVLVANVVSNLVGNGIYVGIV